MSEILTRIVLAARPSGTPSPADFRTETAPIPAPGPGAILVRTIWLSLDPYMRGRMDAGKSYADPVEIGQTMEAAGVGEVIASNAAGFAPGDFVVGRTGWASHAILDAAAARKVDPAIAPLSTALGVLGMPGLTAWVGLTDILEMQPGETVVISAATGAVGSVAVQIAKARGMRVIGVAGGAAKCAHAVEELGADACLDHRLASDARALSDQIALAAPDGVDGYFENVGGKTLQAVLPRLNERWPNRGLRHDRLVFGPGHRRGHAATRRLAHDSRQAPARPGLHRLRPRRPPAGLPRRGRADAARRPDALPREHRRGARDRPQGLHRHALGREFRQATGARRPWSGLNRRLSAENHSPASRLAVYQPDEERNEHAEKAARAKQKSRQMTTRTRFHSDTPLPTDFDDSAEPSGFSEADRLWTRRSALALTAGFLAAGTAPASARFVQTPRQTANHVVISKRNRVMELKHGETTLKRYRIGLGFTPDGHKSRSGDGRTPEGRYWIDRRNPRSSYYLSLGISYPNAQDIARAKAMGVNPGGDIFIHGGPRRDSERGKRDWTAGCIAVSDSEMEEIWTLVPTGIPVTIFG